MNSVNKNKKVYIRAHGRRIKNSYFKLEPNVNVYMNCTDAISYVTKISECLMMQFLLSDFDIEYLDDVINKIKSINIDGFVSYNSAYTTIVDTFEKYKRFVKNNLEILVSKYKEKINKLTKSYDIYKRKNELNMMDKVIMSINNIVSKIYSISEIIENFDTLDNFEKMRLIHKPSYQLLQKYKKIKERFEKSKKKMEWQYLFYDPVYDLCVFSGNLGNDIDDISIRNYVYDKLCLTKKVDLNICPNIEFSADNAEHFRDFICEQGIRIEIKKNNETYMTHEDIVQEINKYLSTVLYNKKYNNLENNIIDNIGLNMLCGKDIKYFKNIIRDKALTVSKELRSAEGNLNKTISMIKEFPVLEGVFSKKVVAEEEKVDELRDKLRELEDFLQDDYEINVDRYYNGKEKLFYPVGEWSDCNIKSKLKDYTSDDCDYDLQKFVYYDIVKKRYLTEDECIKKCKKERNKYLKNECISLRDVLLYLYEIYEMNEDPNMRLDLIVTSCKGEFDIIKNVYGMCKLPLSEYVEKNIKTANGKKMSLMDYDLSRKVDYGLSRKVKKDDKRRRRPCGTILKKDGCPSYCDEPADESRKTCKVKSRRRVKIDKKETD